MDAASFVHERGAVEIASIPRRIWHVPPAHADMSPSPDFARPWRVLRVKQQIAKDAHGALRAESDAEVETKSLLQCYEPNFSPSAPLFSSVVKEPTWFRDVTGIEGSTAYKVTCGLAFALGNVEPVYCRVALFDVSAGCRVSEDFHFDVNAPPALHMATNAVRSALFYAMPNQYAQNLYLVLQASKVMQGDGEVMTLPYCQPEKYATDAEQSKLIEKAAEAAARLGRVHQSLAWGAIALSEGTRQMILYRQKASMSDEQRVALLVDAAKGTYKYVPHPCFALSTAAGRRSSRASKKRSMDTKAVTTPSLLYLLPPMYGDAPRKSGVDHWCREVQPFCLPSATSTLGPTCSGPVAVAYVHVLYLYPLAIDRFQVRWSMVADLLEGQAPIAAFFSGPTLATEALCHVSYHTKTPAFEDELKLALPGQLQASHKLLFSFYQVHCKKLPAGKLPMDLVATATLPLLDMDGVVLQDAAHAISVAAIDSDVKGMALHCRSRLVSSVWSQHRDLHAFLQLDLGSPATDLTQRVRGLRSAPDVMLRYHALQLFRRLTALVGHEATEVRQAAFVALLGLLEKCAFAPVRSTATDTALAWTLVDVAFDEVPGNQAPPVYLSLVAEWTGLLAHPEARAASLAHAGVLLHLVLKSVALQSPVLPQTLEPAAEAALAALLHGLLGCVVAVDDGLLVRKELLVSLGRFALQLFAVVTNGVVAIWLRAAVATVATTPDSTTLIHMTFPFLRLLAEAAPFVALNVASEGLPDAWLAQLLFTSLLAIADEQPEEKIKSQAVGILRRLFVAQGAVAPERLARMVLPVLPRLLALTTPGRLLSSVEDDEATSEVLKREVLVCLAACLRHLPEAERQRFWIPPPSSATPETTTPAKTQHHRGRKAPLAAGTSVAEYTPAVEAHVASGLAALGQLVEVFLADGVPWQQVLSPDTLEQGNRASLLDIEHFMKQRNTNARLLRRSHKADAKEAAHRSLPRNWGKSYLAQRKSTVDAAYSKEEGETPAGAFDACAKHLCEHLVTTVVQSLQALQAEFEAVLDAPGASVRPRRPSSVSPARAVALLPRVVDMLFLLLTRIGHVHFDTALLAHVLGYLTAFLRRFQRALFADAARGLMADEAWCERLLLLAASPSEAIAPLAATLLGELFRASFEQVGTFRGVQSALFNVAAKHLSQVPAALDRLSAILSDYGTLSLHFSACLALLRRLHGTRARLQAAVDGGDVADPEGLEEAAVALLEELPVDWLPTLHRELLDALAAYHAGRGQAAEASACYDRLAITSATLHGALAHWRRARELVDQAALPELSLAIGERMLARLRVGGCFTEFAAVLRSLDPLATALAAQVEAPPGARYFAVSLLLSPDEPVEYIYKRSAFERIADVVAGLEVALSAQLQRRVKALAGRAEVADATVYFKATPVVALPGGRDFVLSVPFSLAGPAKYDRNQFVRRSTLRVAQAFPWLVGRQRVEVRTEVVRCPIESATDDIARRTAALARLVTAAARGVPADVKALTHLLKGSINTEVHGGAPEVIAQFLSAAADGTLLQPDGNCMAQPAQEKAQAALRAALLEFLTAALEVLAISRDAFHRQVEPDADVAALAPLQAEFEKGFVSIVGSFAATFAVESEELVSLKQAISYKLGLAVA
ncbi:hypothetical protein ACHHYP_04445 [Achlya hypogyna]|uniref:Uncharacterized protein n=1 Tax=Achlya hypogyna TaxID=1202772 RepID=A0A1V9Z0Z6_ACHHY|nr:hypothetical protein ACHHYP_04445 [Achlya hypogyna]